MEYAQIEKKLEKLAGIVQDRLREQLTDSQVGIIESYLKI